MEETRLKKTGSFKDAVMEVKQLRTLTGILLLVLYCDFHQVNSAIGHTDYVYCLEVWNEYLCSCSGSIDTIRVWNENGECQHPHRTPMHNFCNRTHFTSDML